MRAQAGPPTLNRLRFPLRTPRLLLRPPRLSDVPALVPLVGDNRVARPTRIPHPYTAANGREFVQANARKRRKGTDVALLLEDRRDHRIVGGTGFHGIDWKDRRFELGYWIAPSEWGRGLAAEAAYAVCREGFRTLGMHRVYATVLAFNPWSARVLRSIGFRTEGRFRQHHRDGRQWTDTLCFGLLETELRRPPKRG
jgi:RimJ/RimL family protein N-acetyltransferase